MCWVCSSSKEDLIKSLSRKHRISLANCLKLEYLPELPSNIIELDISGCHNLKKVEKLPGCLQILNCMLCLNLESLGELPETLLSLNSKSCHNLKIKKLPNSLTDLDCDNNYNLEIEKFPKSLTRLQISHCNITRINYLPKLIFFKCNFCPIILSKLSDTLIRLECSSCKLNTIEIPKKIRSLICDNNNLLKIPDLPDTIEYFSCNRNPIFHLPRIHNRNSTVVIHHCNNLVSIPNLPLVDLDIAHCMWLNEHKEYYIKFLVKIQRMFKKAIYRRYLNNRYLMKKIGITNVLVEKILEFQAIKECNIK